MSGQRRYYLIPHGASIQFDRSVRLTYRVFKQTTGLRASRENWMYTGWIHCICLHKRWNSKDTKGSWKGPCARQGTVCCPSYIVPPIKPYLLATRLDTGACPRSHGRDSCHLCHSRDYERVDACIGKKVFSSASPRHRCSQWLPAKESRSHASAKEKFAAKSSSCKHSTPSRTIIRT